MKPREYAWKEEAPGLYRKVSANKVGREFAEIKKKKGILHPTDVVKAARSPKSAMHRFFEWKDTKAAQRYREWQARNLIGCIREIKIVIKNRKEVREEFTIWIPTKPGSNKGYEDAQDIKEDREKVESILKRAQNDLEAWMKHYNRLRAQFDDVYESAKMSFDKRTKSLHNSIRQ